MSTRYAIPPVTQRALGEAAVRAETHSADAGLDPSSRLIVAEARRRGIQVEVLDERDAYFRLTHGGRSIVCRESLSELTSAIAMSRCDDKRVTARVLDAAGLHIPEQTEVDTPVLNEAFLRRHGSVVVKPARGEQGRGVSVGITTPGSLADAIELAGVCGAGVLLEEVVHGDDLRIVMIDFRLVAAAVRRPPTVTGTGRHTVADLIAEHSRRRAAATCGESRIPFDAETQRCVRECGHELEDVLPEGKQITVRRAANLHTGGTIHDVTDQLHPNLVEVARKAARAIDIPVVGLDLIVPSIGGENYWIIEANERPGLANHEPQPTAERFVDLLFPATA